MIFTSPISAFFSIFSFLCHTCEISRIEDPIVHSYIADFKEDCNKYGAECSDATSIPVFWQKLEDYNIGYCWQAALEFRIMTIYMPVKVIAIDPKWWKELSYFSRKALVYHELGHCELRREHDPEPTSIMYMNILDQYQISKNWDCLVYQMFSGERGSCFDNVLHTPFANKE